MIRIATDVGGTFTDFAAYDDVSRQLTISKTSSTEQIIDGVAECFAKAAMTPEQADHFIHGNTVAINTVIERKGAKTALLTTKGFRDILELARGNIRNSFDLMFATPEPLVPRHLRLEIDERLLAGGKVGKPLDREQATEVIRRLGEDGIQAVAICLLHSYANPAHEQALERLVIEQNAALFSTISSDILRQYREYERTSTTVINAYVGPRVGTFFDQLQDYLKDGDFHGKPMILQSNGGTMSIDAAKRQPVRTMESGPVGGTIAAAHIGQVAGYENVVAFDMGGTTAKVSIVKRGHIEIADGYHIGGYEMGYAVQLPVADILEVGAGGGSIAHFDQAGALKVGPVSAGAIPGPACYGLGGDQPTVTDADVVMGRLNPDYFLGGEITLDAAAAAAAIEHNIRQRLALDTLKAAHGIAKVADTNMAHAVRIMTVQKGHDPREFAMVAFGGAGPCHAVSVARELEIGTVVIPPHPGIFSALGMLLADARDEYVLSHVRPLGELVPDELEALFADMERPGAAVMRDAGFADKDMVFSRALEMRYMGQEFTLVVDLPSGRISAEMLADLADQFNQLHEARYGHAFANIQPEIVSLRAHVRGLLPKLNLSLADGTGNPGAAEPVARRQVYFEDHGAIECAIYRRQGLGPEAEIVGPAIIEEVMSTTVVHPGDLCRVDKMGNLVIRLGR